MAQFFVREQYVPLNEGQLHERYRPTRSVEGHLKVFVLFSHELPNRQVPRMVGLGAIASDALKLAENTFAESVERDFPQLRKTFQSDSFISPCIASPFGHEVIASTDFPCITIDRRSGCHGHSQWR